MHWQFHCLWFWERMIFAFIGSHVRWLTSVSMLRRRSSSGSLRPVLNGRLLLGLRSPSPPLVVLRNGKVQLRVGHTRTRQRDAGADRRRGSLERVVGTR